MSTEPAAPPAKTMGDYGTEIEKAIGTSNNMADAAPVLAEMKAALPPTDPSAPVEQAEPPAPTNQGLQVYCDQLQQCIDTNNVAKGRALAEEMVKVEPPTEQPADATQSQQQYQQPSA